ncbi:MAG: hypothetical protein ACKVHO_01490 [Verrucomicrobiia bacterium]|jgi:hypothetical protein
MSEDVKEHLALRLVRFIRRTQLSTQRALPAIEELAGTGPEDDTIDSILEILEAQPGEECRDLVVLLRDCATARG